MQHELLTGADVQREGERTDPIEPHPRAVGRGCETLAAIAAVDDDRVRSVATFVQIASVARIPDQLVVSRIPEDPVAAGATDQGVIGRPTEKLIVAGLAENAGCRHGA